MRLIQTPAYTNSEIYAGLNIPNEDKYVKGGLSEQLLERLLDERSYATILSRTASRSASSLNIKVSGGEKKTTPLPRTKDKRTRKRSSETTGDNYDGDDSYQINSETDVEQSSYGRKNRNKMTGQKGSGRRNRRDRADSTQKSERYNDKSKQRNSSHRRKGITNLENGDNLEVPIGQWIVIICVILVFIFHYFNLGAKLSLSSKKIIGDGGIVTKKKKIQGKKISGGKKNKKRVKKDDRSKQKNDGLSVDDMDINMSSSPSETTDSSLRQIPEQTQATPTPPVVEKEKEELKSKETDSIVTDSTKKKKNKGKKNEKINYEQEQEQVVLPLQSQKIDPHPLLVSENKNDLSSEAAPDSVSTDGSSSTQDDNIPTTNGEMEKNTASSSFALNAYDKEIHGYINDDQPDDDNDGWITVSSAATGGKRQHKNDSSSNNNNPDSHVEEKVSVDESIVKPDDVKVTDTTTTTTADNNNNNNNNSEMKVDPPVPQSSSSTTTTTTTTPVVENSDNRNNDPEVNSSAILEDDEAYARMLQDQEAELAKSTSTENNNNNNNSNDQCWEEVSSKKKKKGGKSA